MQSEQTSSLDGVTLGFELLLKIPLLDIMTVTGFSTGLIKSAHILDTICFLTEPDIYERSTFQL